MQGFAPLIPPLSKGQLYFQERSSTVFEKGVVTARWKWIEQFFFELPIHGQEVRGLPPFCTPEPGAAVPPTLVSAGDEPCSDRTGDFSCCSGVTEFSVEMKWTSWNFHWHGMFFWEVRRNQGLWMKTMRGEAVGDQKSSCIRQLLRPHDGYFVGKGSCPVGLSVQD